MYFISKQQNSSCLPTRLYDVTIPGTKPIVTASISSMEVVPALNKVSRRL